MRYRYSTGKDGKLFKKAVVYTCDEHGINFADVDNEAISIIKRLKASGYDTYIVGGAVRDLILGKKPKDFDIVSTASPARIKKIFRNSRIIGRRFRLVHVYFGQRVFEVSTFRSLKDGHAGNTFGTMDDDVFRRDFTMNALYYDPQQQIVVDYVDGMNDIKKRQVKPVIPLAEIFSDDPVRMIRAVKYAAVTNSSLPFNVKYKITKQAELISSISPSRLTEEIFKILNSNKASTIVDMLDKMGLYRFLQPQAVNLMRKDSNFRLRYLKTMAAFFDSTEYRNHPLIMLFHDYLEGFRKWEPGIIENSKEIYYAVRSFILPMNPPRFELEKAVKKFLTVHGMSVLRPHPKPISEAGVKPKRKRRRKKKISIIKEE